MIPWLTAKNSAKMELNREKFGMITIHPSILREAYRRQRAKVVELHEENARLRKLLEDKQ